MFRIVDRLHVDAEVERARLIAGLMAPAAAISPKYFYDALGCALYEAICLIDEYYPTRAERGIFEVHRDAIAAALGRVETFIDLGAGDGRKAEAWLPFVRPQRYLAVDIARGALEAALTRMAPLWPEIEMTGLVTDFSQTLDIPSACTAGRCIVFYPGSSIGNFTPREAVRMLREIKALLAAGDGALLIGVDARKATDRLVAAYDDALGVTAAFNRNVLRHLNRLLGSDFDLGDWQHLALYDERQGRIEMHLAARRAVTVNIGGTPRPFAAAERIHTENSWKYTREGFKAVLQEAGFAGCECWSDEQQSFLVLVAR